MLLKLLRSFCAGRPTLRRLRREDAGAVVAFVAIIPVLAGIVAAGVETGKVYTVKRQMQNAADGAALAASADLIAGQSTARATTDALYETQRNGFTNGVNNVTVSVTSPPSSGPYVNTPGAVQVKVTTSQSFILGAVLNKWLGQSSSGFTISATSVAAQGTYTTTTTGPVTTTTTTSTADSCITALTPNAEQGVTINNFGGFVSDCTIMSNGTAASNNANASVYMGSFTFAQFKSVWSRGSFYATGYTILSLINPTKTSQTTSIADPYSALTIPTLSHCDYTNYSPSWASTLNVSPGIYCGGLRIASGASTVDFSPGTYYIANGDLSISSSATVQCSLCTNGAGVTFVLTQTTGNSANIGGVNISSNQVVNLSAPSSGSYAGVLFYQDRNAPAGTMSSTSKIFNVSGISSVALNGAIYFPSNKIALSNSGITGVAATGCTVLLGRYISLSSYGAAYVAGCGAFGTTPPGIATTTSTTTIQPVTTTVTKARVLQ
jgi:Flp pilus assembly protein TadG